MSLSTLIDAIRGGNLSVGSTEENGFSGLRVARAEVDLLSTAARQLAIGLIPAAAFGVSVGIKGEGRFLALISGAHTTGKVIRHPTMGAAHVYVDSQDISNFHNRFVTITTLVKETGLHRNTLRKRLDDAAVPFFAPDGANFGFLYLREVVRTALRLTLPFPADMQV